MIARSKNICASPLVPRHPEEPAFAKASAGVSTCPPKLEERRRKDGPQGSDLTCGHPSRHEAFGLAPQDEVFGRPMHQKGGATLLIMRFRCPGRSAALPDHAPAS